MTAQSIRLHSLEYRDVRTYIIAALFVVGNVVLPQICPSYPEAASPGCRYTSLPLLEPTNSDGASESSPHLCHRSSTP